MKEETVQQERLPAPAGLNGAAAAWLRHARAAIVAVFGGTIVLIGVVLLVLPGPGLLVILAGLAVLATEFAWARWLLRRARERFKQLSGRLRPPPRDQQARP